MRDGRPEMGDVCRTHGSAYLRQFADSVTPGQRRVLRALAQCRTAELGGHNEFEKCDTCGYTRIAYNSCRNRHCPKCRQSKAAEWLNARSAEILPVEYFHVVFTLPQELSLLALQHPRALYGLLFSCAAETLQTIARDPKHLGAEIGFLAVLHTWGQTLTHHPHVHCIVPGGGLSPDRAQWVGCRPGFFLPVRVLSRLFRRRFLEQLGRLLSKPMRAPSQEWRRLQDLKEWNTLRRQLDKKEWVVYAKPPFGGPKQVLKYLARYTHKIAISNRRLVSVNDGAVTFEWKDYAHGNRPRTMTLAATEFLRRFLQHVLPPGLQRIRHFGLLANRGRRQTLKRCRELLGVETAAAESGPSSESAAAITVTPMSPASERRCPVCRHGRMVRNERVEPQRVEAVSTAKFWDTS